MKPYDPILDKNTVVFSNQAVENVFSLLVKTLDETSTQYQISKQSWKLSFSKGKTYEYEDQEPIQEQASILIELMDAGDDIVAV